MQYNLKKPCDSCPFLTDIPAFLRSGRVREIERSLEQGEFPCHKTIDYDALEEYNLDEDEDGDTHIPFDISNNAKHCAGALILLEKEGRSHQMMRISERFGDYKHEELDMQAPVFNSFDDMAEAQSE